MRLAKTSGAYSIAPRRKLPFSVGSAIPFAGSGLTSSVPTIHFITASLTASSESVLTETVPFLPFFSTVIDTDSVSMPRIRLKNRASAWISSRRCTLMFASQSSAPCSFISRTIRSVISTYSSMFLIHASYLPPISARHLIAGPPIAVCIDVFFPHMPPLRHTRSLLSMSTDFRRSKA